MREAAVFLMVFLAACASTGQSGGGGYDSPITSEDIAQGDYETAYEVVRSERPRWLRSRGTSTVGDQSTVIIYVNGVRRGGPEELRNLPSSAVREIRYYDSRDATMRFGTGHPEGVIEVVM